MIVLRKAASTTRLSPLSPGDICHAAKGLLKQVFLHAQENGESQQQHNKADVEGANGVDMQPSIERNEPDRSQQQQAHRGGDDGGKHPDALENNQGLVEFRRRCEHGHFVAGHAAESHIAEAKIAGNRVQQKSIRHTGAFPNE